MKKAIVWTAGLLMASGCMAQQLPVTTIKDLDTGRKVPFNETVVQGKVTLITFWASWCIPCKKAIKNINNTLPGWKREVSFDYMTVSLDDQKAEDLARNYAKLQRWNFPYYVDVSSDLKRSLNFQNVPYTVIVGKDGKVAYTRSGYEEGAEAEFLAKMKELAR